jgi:hypothetical protein
VLIAVAFIGGAIISAIGAIRFLHWLFDEELLP